MIKKLTLSFILLAAQTAFALQQNKPSSCPTLNALASVGVNNAVYGESQTHVGYWTAYQQSNYFATDTEWSFFITPFAVDSARTAIANATASIPLLTILTDTPVESDDHLNWACFYKGEGDIFAFTASPTISPGDIEGATTRYRSAIRAV